METSNQDRVKIFSENHGHEMGQSPMKGTKIVELDVPFGKEACKKMVRKINLP